MDANVGFHIPTFALINCNIDANKGEQGMKNDLPIAVLDSGVGGISVLERLKNKLPNERFLYDADNANLPYGNLPKDVLCDLVFSNVERVVSRGVKGVVLACNTASLCVGPRLKQSFGNLIFLIRPPMLSASRMGKTAVFCTVRSAECFEQREGVKIVACKNLAKIIEESSANDEQIYAEILREKENVSECVDAVVLGCTHYALKRELFQKAFPSARLLDGIDSLVSRVRKGISPCKTRENSKEQVALFLSNDNFDERIRFLNLLNEKIYRKKWLQNIVQEENAKLHSDQKSFVFCFLHS
jgi:glutamate racemase